MEHNEILEGNKLIAEFMELKYSDNTGIFQNPPYYIKVIHLEYHYSWDWLMPVVEKIQADSCKFSIEKNYCKIWAIGTFEASTTIEAVWLACVEFIKWYNQNK